MKADKTILPGYMAGALPTATQQWQQRALDHGFKYWRAPDAHGVTATQEQMINLLRDVLGVEVDVVPGDPAPVAALPDDPYQQAISEMRNW